MGRDGYSKWFNIILLPISVTMTRSAGDCRSLELHSALHQHFHAANVHRLYCLDLMNRENCLYVMYVHVGTYFVKKYQLIPLLNGPMSLLKNRVDPNHHTNILACAPAISPSYSSRSKSRMGGSSSGMIVVNSASLVSKILTRAIEYL